MSISISKVKCFCKWVILPCTGAHKEEEGLVLGLYKGTPQKLRHVDGSFQEGNLDHHTIKSVWRSEKLERIRYLHKNGRRCEIEPGCRNCSHGVKNLVIKDFMKKDGVKKNSLDFKTKTWLIVEL